jgi:hypothetical protein
MMHAACSMQVYEYRLNAEDACIMHAYVNCTDFIQRIHASFKLMYCSDLSVKDACSMKIHETGQIFIQMRHAS